MIDYRSLPMLQRTLSLSLTVALALSAPASAQFYYGGYGYGSAFGDPYGGYLQGSASVISSQGKFMVQRQQAEAMKEGVKRSKIDTQRKAFDEWRYERELTPTLEEERERTRLENLSRSRNDPPLTEIWSGKALNDILTDMQTLKPSSVAAPGPMLDPEILRKINITNGVGSGSVGVLRNGGQLRWPFVLRGKDYKEQREKLDELAPKAVSQAETNNVDPDVIQSMQKLISTLTAKLKDHVDDLSPNQYIEGKRYLRDLNDAVTKLTEPNAANYFDKKWAAQGHSVVELIRYMTDQGLKFAPATPGDEAAYTSLQRSMAAYDAPSINSRRVENSRISQLVRDG
jgi:hypothetical protein